jgi:hypothetical protein
MAPLQSTTNQDCCLAQSPLDGSSQRDSVFGQSRCPFLASRPLAISGIGHLPQTELLRNPDDGSGRTPVRKRAGARRWFAACDRRSPGPRSGVRGRANGRPTPRGRPDRVCAGAGSASGTIRDTSRQARQGASASTATTTALSADRALPGGARPGSARCQSLGSLPQTAAFSSTPVTSLPTPQPAKRRAFVSCGSRSRRRPPAAARQGR